MSVSNCEADFVRRTSVKQQQRTKMDRNHDKSDVHRKRTTLAVKLSHSREIAFCSICYCVFCQEKLIHRHTEAHTHSHRNSFISRFSLSMSINGAHTYPLFKVQMREPSVVFIMKVNLYNPFSLPNFD